jgi:hypothetical protein
MITSRTRALMNRGTRLAVIAGFALLLLPMSTGYAKAQETGGQTAGRGGAVGQFAGMQRASGEVTAVAGANITIKTEDGSTLTVVTTDNTRMMKGRGVTVKVADVKAGDGVMAAGNLDAPNKTIHAAVLFVTDAAQVKALKENLGKTYIVGKVTAIDLDNAKMTIERPDHVSQTIGFDESTSFRRGGGMGGRGGGTAGMVGSGAAGGASPQGAAAPPAVAAASGESITLADVKVGDEVRGTGAVKGGTFVPAQLVVGTPGQRRRDGGAQGTPATPAAGSAPSGPGGSSR